MEEAGTVEIRVEREGMEQTDTEYSVHRALKFDAQMGYVKDVANKIGIGQEWREAKVQDTDSVQKVMMKTGFKMDEALELESVKPHRANTLQVR